MQWPLGSAERRRNASMAWEVVQQGPNFCARLPHRWWTLPTKRMILPTLNGNFTNKHGEFTIFYQQTWWVYHILPTNMVSLPYFTNKHGEFTIFYQQTWWVYHILPTNMELLPKCWFNHEQWWMKRKQWWFHRFNQENYVDFTMTNWEFTKNNDCIMGMS